MSLDEILKVINENENVEVFDTSTFLMYHPERDKLPLEWFQYVVTDVYSLFNESKHDTKIRVEVKPWIKQD